MKTLLLALTLASLSSCAPWLNEAQRTALKADAAFKDRTGITITQGLDILGRSYLDYQTAAAASAKQPVKVLP